MKLQNLQEARYAGDIKAMQDFLQFFYPEQELSDDDSTIYFPHEEYIARNLSVGTMNNEVMWIKILRNDPSRIGVMYVDEEHDWLPTKEVLNGFYIFKVKKVYGK